MFELHNVRWKHILDIDRLTVREGVTTCIAGDSGSGKSSLLRLLSGMISPDRGEIFYKGAPMSALNPVLHRRQVVTAPQAPAIFEGSVRDNLQIGLLYTDRPQATESELRQAMEEAELSASLEQDAGTLSGGEKQRLAIARILLLRPPVLLLDEPTSSLDEGTAERILARIVGSASKSGQSIVMISHSPAVIRRFGDYRVTIEAGKVTEDAEVRR